MIRVGFSEDIHRFEDNGRSFILGGVKIPSSLGIVSHSDGDVIYHALGEAFLGALALGDLGTFFPDNDDKYLNMDSSIILKECYQKVLKHQYSVINVDINVSLEAPKIKKYIQEMRENIAKILNIDLSCVSIKAQTNEKCDDVGHGKAVKASAIVLIESE